MTVVFVRALYTSNAPSTACEYVLYLYTNSISCWSFLKFIADRMNFVQAGGASSSAHSLNGQEIFIENDTFDLCILYITISNRDLEGI